MPFGKNGSGWNLSNWVNFLVWCGFIVLIMFVFRAIFVQLLCQFVIFIFGAKSPIHIMRCQDARSQAWTALKSCDGLTPVPKCTPAGRRSPLR